MIYGVLIASLYESVVVKWNSTLMYCDFRILLRSCRYSTTLQVLTTSYTHSHTTKLYLVGTWAPSKFYQPLDMFLAYSRYPRTNVVFSLTVTGSVRCKVIKICGESTGINGVRYSCAKLNLYLRIYCTPRSLPSLLAKCVCPARCILQ